MRSRPSLDSCGDPFSLPIFKSSSQFLAVALALCASVIAARRIGSVAWDGNGKTIWTRCTRLSSGPAARPERRSRTSSK
jgi:hypothetical protein